MPNQAVRRQNWDALRKRLSDEQPIERIPMMKRQRDHAGDVAERNRERLKPVRRHLLREEPFETRLQRQLSEAHLDRDLPTTGEADEARLLRPTDGFARVLRQPRRIVDPPQEDVRIEEERHAYW